MRSSLEKVRVFLEMIKVEHSIFALPFAYLGLMLGERGLPDFHLLFWVTAAMVSFRSMGMALNRLIDIEIDRLNPRTRNRALPAGRLKVSFVGTVTIFCFLLFEWCAYILGPLCFFLSPIPVLLAVFYPWTKRFTWFSHFVLGMILGIAPYGAWLASRGAFSWIPGMIMLGVLTWVAGFDMIYALQDLAFDREQGLHSFPARFGSSATLRMTQFLHGASVTSWFFAGGLAGCGPLYFLGIGGVAFFLLREHWLIRSFGMKKIDEAFFSMNAMVSLFLFMAVVGDFTLGRWFR